MTSDLSQSYSHDFDYTSMAKAIRFLAADAVENAKSGHPGMPLGFADVATVLWRDFLRFDPEDPQWPNRDRLILSAGHGCMLLYAALHLTGYSAFSLDELKRFRRIGSIAAGHPEYQPSAGIETTTGPLGQGFANAVGIAMGQQWLGNRFKQDCPLDHKTYAIVGDGCLMEGIAEESLALAGHWKLKNLICLFDDNRITIDGATELVRSDDMVKRFSLHNWDTISVNGHDHAAIHKALARAQNATRPTFIAFRTYIGEGAPNKKDSSGVHGAPLGPDEIAAMRDALNWPHPPFHIPDPIRLQWQQAGIQHQGDRKAWYANLTAEQRSCLKTLDRSKTVAAACDALKELANDRARNPVDLASRISSQDCINTIAPHIPTLIGGSADLTGSNNTKSKNQKSYSSKDPSASYLHYGIREHGMAAIMNGLTLYGLIPYGGTFLTFSDYMRPSIRLSALMRLQTIFVFTHDGIGLGEDGPTHQPIEHLASLRAIPRLNVFRPADAVETAECWQLALESETYPSALCLSRQVLPGLRSDAAGNKSASGGYVLEDCQHPNFVIIASGSEVSLCTEAARILKSSGHNTRVVSMPCLDLWWQQPSAYRNSVLGTAPRIIVEAGIAQSWQGLLRENDRFIGLEDFGASGPGSDVYSHFGLTTERIVDIANGLGSAS